MTALREAVPGRSLVTHADFWRVLHQVQDRKLCARVIRFVAVCVRVAWSCYKAGGSDVPVQLPHTFTLLPADLNPEPYIDVFDSESDLESDLLVD